MRCLGIMKKKKCSYFKDNTCMVIKSKVPEKQVLEYCKGFYIACKHYKKRR